MNRVLCYFVGFAMALTLASCAYLEKPKDIVPTELISAPTSKATRLVIVLPGRGDDLQTLKKFRIAQSIQQALPDADVVLAEFTLPYYMEGRSVQRLHEQIVQPARQRGYREIYLMGASLGGMGALIYEREHPNEMSGLILMAPYMGDASISKEIDAAGGLSQWKAGSPSELLDGSSVTREEWRVVQSWIANRARAHTVWLICGQSDRFHDAAGKIAAVLPPLNYIEPAGGHAWTVWMQGAKQVFARIRSLQ